MMITIDFSGSLMIQEEDLRVLLLDTNLTKVTTLKVWLDYGGSLDEAIIYDFADTIKKADWADFHDINLVQENDECRT